MITTSAKATATLAGAVIGALILYDSQHRGRIVLLSSNAGSGAVVLGTDQKGFASIAAAQKSPLPRGEEAA